MKITFVERSPNDKVGSYRIWVKDLTATLNELGHSASIVRDHRNISGDTDTVIFSKSSYREIENFTTHNNHIKVGAINFPCDYQNDDIDFAIVGSYEEKTSLSYYDSVFVYPLIERKFINLPKRIHSDSNVIRLCFHGHYPHLFKFFPHLQSAIEIFSKSYNVELTIITGHTHFMWTKDLGMPQDVKINHYTYDDTTFSSILNSCDIGLVPNVSDILAITPNLKKLTSVDCGLYDTDFFMRYKNKTNSGRAYVLYQHGIPVIHDMSPSNFEFMGKSNQYSCAYDSRSWLRELKKFSNARTRQIESDINRLVFEREFNPHEHGKRLIEFIEKI